MEGQTKQEEQPTGLGFHAAEVVINYVSRSTVASFTSQGFDNMPCLSVWLCVCVCVYKYCTTSAKCLTRTQAFHLPGKMLKRKSVQTIYTSFSVLDQCEVDYIHLHFSLLTE